MQSQHRELFYTLAVLEPHVDEQFSIPNMFIKIAIQNGDLQKVQTLLRRTNTIPNNSMMLLAIHCNNNVAMTRVLLDNGADPNMSDGKTTLLMRGFWIYYYPEVFNLLIEYGADINHKFDGLEYRNVFEYHDLHHAAIILEDIAAHPNFDLNVRFEHTRDQDILHILLERGWDVNTRTSANNTLLHLYAREKNDVALLVEHGADIFVRNDNGNTPLHESFHRKSMSTSSYLINHVNCHYPERKAAFINQRNNNGDTALHLAMVTRSYKALNLLLTHGADMFLVNNDGLTAFKLAQQCYEQNKDPYNKMVHHVQKNKNAYITVLSNKFEQVSRFYGDDVMNLIFDFFASDPSFNSTKVSRKKRRMMAMR